MTHLSGSKLGDFCPLTGLPTRIYQEGADGVFRYYTEFTGLVRYSDLMGSQFSRLNEYQKQTLLKAYQDEKPPIIDTAFLRKTFGSDV